MDKVNMCQIQKQIDNSKEEMMGVISFILAIFPLSFVINSYLVAMKNIGENQGSISYFFHWECLKKIEKSIFFMKLKI